MRYTPKTELDQRVAKLQVLLKQQAIDGVILVQNADLFYFSGTIQQSHLFIPAEGKPVLARDRSGIPVAIRLEIDKKFKQFEKGDIDGGQLKKELDRWDVFEQYEDRFLRYFKK